MAYQIYTPMQGPTIPTSIFSRAMERGARMGTMIDSPETAKLKGEILGKEKALDMQMKRENIESANLRQELMEVGVERQQEALEADKRQNRLAPIKEGLNIAGGVMDMITGVQTIMGNQNRLEMQEQQIELNQIKIDTEEQMGSVTRDTAKQVALNDNARAHQEAADSKIVTDFAEAERANDSDAIKEIINRSTFHSFANRKSDNATQILASALQKGAIHQAEFDDRMDVIYSAKYNNNRIREDTAYRKKLEASSERFEQDFSAAHDVLENFLPPGREYTPRNMNTYSVIADGAHPKKENGFLDLSKKADPGVSVKGDWYLVDNTTGEILREIPDNGFEISKLVNKAGRSRAARDRIDAEYRARTRAGRGQQQQPEAGGGDNLQNKQKIQTIPDGGLATLKKQQQAQRLQGAKDTLRQYGVGAKDVVGQQPGVVRGAIDTANKYLNKAFPFIENVSGGDAELAENAAENAARKTINMYESGSREDQKALVDKIADMGGGADFDESRFYDEVHTEGPTIERMYFKDPQGADRLKDLFRRDIIDSMEYVKENTPRKLSKAQQSRAYERKFAGNEPTTFGTMESRKSYETIKQGKPTVDDKSPEEITRRIQPVLKQIKLDAGWSDNKAASVAKTVVNVENNPYLEGESIEVKAVAAIESGGDVEAKSPTGVKGLMQVETDTANLLNEKFGTSFDNSTPEGSLALAKLLLLDLGRKYNGDKFLMYAAYNAGEPAIDLAKELAGDNTRWSEIRLHLYDALKALYSAGRYKVNPRKKAEETRKYPDDVIRYEELFNQLA